MKKLYIMRGLPGSGKSTKAQQIKKEAELAGLSVVICSADDFRMVGNEYVFKPTREPHDRCQELFRKSVDKEVDVIIVDNVNNTMRSMAPYVGYAHPDYEIEFVTFQPIDIDTLMARGTHGVPRETYDRMLRQWVPTPKLEDFFDFS